VSRRNQEDAKLRMARENVAAAAAAEEARKAKAATKTQEQRQIWQAHKTKPAISGSKEGQREGESGPQELQREALMTPSLSLSELSKV
jgi:hypothetical protein